MYYILLQEFGEQHGQKARTRSICRSLFAAGVVSITVYISINDRFKLLQGVPKVLSSYYRRHNFWSKLYFCMKFLNDVYCFTEYIYSKSQYPACPPLFVITFRSRCGMEWDKSCSVESGIFFQACLSRLFRSLMILGVGYSQATSSIMLQRFSTGLISGEFGAGIFSL